ncbi:MAG TPA: enolase C-terminal domain-like protein [Streptosporangiaceae bacterium]
MRPTAAYNSNGLSLIEPRAAADEALELAAEDFRAIKMRLGRPSGRDDLAAVRAVRAAVPADVALIADYNQALSPDTVQERCHRLDDEGLYWIEEPVRHDDYRTPKSALTFSPPRHGPLDPIRGLGRPHPPAATGDRRRLRAAARPAWHRPGVERDAVSHFRRGQTSMSMASLVRGPLLRIPLAAPGEKLL